ncbi:hypothetical protein ABIB50_002768 [Mucilaginibacter sp. UYCu711]
MKAPIIVIPFLSYAGMALFPVILVQNKASKSDRALIRHETIHLMQQRELLVIPFYVLYSLHYLLNLFLYGNHDQAYRAIVFEKEAYQYDGDESYLNNRSTWAWVKCFRNK